MPVADASGTQYWVLRTQQHWLRCDHDGTALDAETNLVTLARDPTQRPGKPVTPGDPAQLRYGAAFDRCGRLWRAVPWGPYLERVASDGTIVRLGQGSDPIDGCPTAELGLSRPRGLAIDGLERLYVADEGARRVIIVELTSGRVVARLRVPDLGGRASRPWDLAADPTGEGAYLLDRGTRAVWRIRPDRAPSLLLGPGGAYEHDGQQTLHDATALAVLCDGALLLLDRDPTFGGNGARVVLARRHDIRTFDLPDDARVPPVADATTLALDSGGYLWVGGYPVAPMSGPPPAVPGDAKETLVRYVLAGVAPDDLELELHYDGEAQPWLFDGGALIIDGDGDVVYTTADGVSFPSPGDPNYRRTASVVTFALDSGITGCTWHRVFFEACLPEHTGLSIRTRTADDTDGNFPLGPPQGFSSDAMRPAGGGPVYPRSADDWVEMPHLLRRPAGADRPFYQPQYSEGVSLDLYEGLVFSPPGRFLWLELTLTGTDRRTPQVGGLRAYYPRPSYLKYLPEIYREDPRAAQFLDRALSIFELFHSELDAVRDHLKVLFEPEAVPEEALDWLAGWLGLVLDPRWPLDRRRRLVAEAARLYCERGTLCGMTRFLRIYTDHPFQFIEAFRARRTRGVIVGADPACGEAVIGPGLVVSDTFSLLTDTRGYAHRFILFVAGELTDTERAVIGDIVELEKPAHTLATICDATETMAIGTRSLVGINTIVGKVRCLDVAVVGDDWVVGRNVVVGGQPSATRTLQVGTANLGRNTIIR